MRVGILTGTRPDIIKQAPVYWEANKRGHEAILIHTTQHWSHHLFTGVYADMNLPMPDYVCSYGNQPSMASGLAKMVSELDNLLRSQLKDLDVLLVHGDTLTCVAGALAAHLNCVPVGHVEAGLRTFSREPFPEQMNTKATDACSDLHFAATGLNARNLLNEGFPKERVFVVGNTVVDAAFWAKKKGKSKDVLRRLGIPSKKKIVYCTVHRKENTMHKHRFEAIMDAVIDASEEFTVVLSQLPGTMAAIEKYGLNKKLDASSVHQIHALPNYTDVIGLLSKSHILLTDSGGLQEEGAALKVPCVTCRYVTDRPESVEVGVNLLAPPTNSKAIIEKLLEADERNAEMRKKPNPYGNGNAAKKIVVILERFEGRFIRWDHEDGN